MKVDSLLLDRYVLHWYTEICDHWFIKLIDHIITTHPAYPKLQERAEKEQRNVHDSTLYLIGYLLWYTSPISHTVLHETLEGLQYEAEADSLTELTKDVHLYPDFHGKVL